MDAIAPPAANLPRAEDQNPNANNADGNNDQAGGGGDEPAMDLPQALKILESIQEEFNHYNRIGLLSLDLQSNILARRAVAIARIPNFWRQAIVGLRYEHLQLRGEEPQCLNSLINIEIESLWSDDLDVKKEVGCKYKFTFGPNPYFTDTELVKEYVYEAKRPPRKSSASRVNWIRGAERSLSLYDWGAPFGFFDWLCNKRIMHHYVDNDIAFRIKHVVWRDPLCLYNDATGRRHH